MIGLLDLDLYSKTSTTSIIPNLEIMKLATYYRIEKNQFCRLLSLNEPELTNYDKIYCFSEAHGCPKVPEQYLRANQVIYGGTGFTLGKYVPFEDPIIDFTIPKVGIYKDYLKERYNDGVKSRVISHVLDNTYYRCYANKEKLPIPPILPKKQVFLYDRDFFYDDWEDIIQEIADRRPSSIIRIHPVVCHKLSDFFKLRTIQKFSRENKIILDLNIDLEDVYYMIKKYKKQLLAEITISSNVFLQLGGNYKTNYQYFKDFIYKINLLYCFWSEHIPIKIYYELPMLGYKNPLHTLCKKISNLTTFTKANRVCTINERINAKTIITKGMEERDLLLKFFPSSKTLFDQSYETVSKGGRWRI